MPVSIGLPVRNAEQRIDAVVKSILTQDHDNLELVISDNASSDGTEDICRELARADARIAYYRQPENIGLENNFIATMRLARGTFFRWVSDDDSLAPSCVSRCVECFAEDDRRILVTTQVGYIGSDGVVRTEHYHGTKLSSGDPVRRFAEMLRLLNESRLLMDPLYGLMRRDTIAAIPRRPILSEDQVFAAKIALAGPWGHVPEVLTYRGWKRESRPIQAGRMGMPRWHATVVAALLCRELLQCVRNADLTPDQRRQARAAVLRWYARRRRLMMTQRTRRLATSAARLLVPGRRDVDTGAAQPDVVQPTRGAASTDRVQE
jgi:glycosyltransferase involved in cell wall biosynthesis